MENASKALIIAGAILLSILIISLGIAIFNQASGVVNNNAMTEVEVNSFNQKFEQYTGDKVRGANINALIQAVNTNNMANNDDASKQVTIEGIDLMQGSTNQYKKSAQTGKTYKAQPTETTTGGLISKIKIEENH